MINRKNNGSIDHANGDSASTSLVASSSPVSSGSLAASTGVDSLGVLRSLSIADQETALHAAASALVERFQFASTFGFNSFSGKRDLFTALGYLQTLSIADCRARYRRGGIAKRIVNYLPKRTWAGNVEIIENEDPKIETKFEKEVHELFTRLAVKQKILRADILAGIGRYSCLLIGAPAGISGDLSSELPRLRPENIAYLRPLAEDQCVIEKYVDGEINRNNPRFGLPEYYTVNTSGTNVLGNTGWSGLGNQPSTVATRVHWTRIIHIVHNPLESDVFGQPELEAVWNLLDDLYKVVGGGAEAAWNRANPGLHVNEDPALIKLGLKPSSKSRDELEDKLDEYTHGLRRIIQTTGYNITPLNAQVDKYDTNLKGIETLIAGTIEIPQRRLFGSERGELASSQDKNDEDDTIQARCEDFGEPLLRDIIDRFIKYGALSKPKEYQIVWPEEDELTEKEKAENAYTIAKANQLQAKIGDTPLKSSDEIRDETWGLEPLEIELEAPEEKADTKEDENDENNDENGSNSDKTANNDSNNELAA